MSAASQFSVKQAVASAMNCADAQTQEASELREYEYIVCDCKVRTHKEQPLMVAAGPTQASTQGGMDEVPCALTATATAAIARKSLENIFSEGRFLGVVRKLKGKVYFCRFIPGVNILYD